MAGVPDHLKPFLRVLHGPYRPDGTFNGHSRVREMYVPIFNQPGMEIPVGAVVRGDWLVPLDLAEPAQQPHTHGLLPVLRQPDEPELLRGDGGVASQSRHADQFSRMDRVDSSGNLLTCLKAFRYLG